ncbi:hypothetical protein M405DRAFT_903878 [Rhizopogon salebrosus TDB-379]|nr:hypothetical protein M405DRAFT_903878 [Rhizopogon salebrosus TDB-379]
MWITNAGLTDRHSYDSRPLSWPHLHRGINFWTSSPWTQDSVTDRCGPRHHIDHGVSKFSPLAYGDLWTKTKSSNAMG